MTPRLELVVLASWEQARAAGFDDRGRHRQDPCIAAWWPGVAVDRLRANRFGRVTVSDSFQRACWDNPRVYDGLREVRVRLTDEDAIWMEL